MKVQTIFRDADIEVIVRDGQGESVAVSFSNWTSVQPRPLWEKQISGSGIFFVAMRNHWYQIKGLEAAFVAIEPHLAKFRRKILMGSSMGGFAAIAFAERLGAQRSVAISPQISLDPSLAPFEKRWRTEAAAIDEWRHRIASSCIPAHVIFDPQHAVDNAHAASIEAQHQCANLWPFPFSGHPSGFALADLNLLDWFVHDAVSGETDEALFSPLAEEYRRLCSQSVTVAINDFRYGIRMALDMTEEQIFSLRGSNAVKQQLIDLVSKSKVDRRRKGS